MPATSGFREKGVVPKKFDPLYLGEKLRELLETGNLCRARLALAIARKAQKKNKTFSRKVVFNFSWKPHRNEIYTIMGMRFSTNCGVGFYLTLNSYTLSVYGVGAAARKPSQRFGDVETRRTASTSSRSDEN